MAISKGKRSANGTRYVIVKSYRHHKTGKIVRPRNGGVFRIPIRGPK